MFVEFHIPYRKKEPAACLPPGSSYSGLLHLKLFPFYGVVHMGIDRRM